ncbi:GCN5-related N-acetyltransferase [Pseudoalteromonas luteoviolacea B = ATCC 29581]|nr:GCN5-related N-acetyltransferase [Pseudoalteromonas luteoviolacea B = ATCC 29581]
MFRKTSLENEHVALIPLEQAHLHELLHAGQSPSVFTWVFDNYCRSEHALHSWFNQTAQFDAQLQLVFAIVEKTTDNVIGTTRFFRLDPVNLSCEIGHTFITDRWQRTHINTNVKYLMLQHAFETLGLVRVEFRTHEQNDKSRRAIARLGATFEGLSRKDRRLPDGTYRNTAKFAMIDDDWPECRNKLMAKLTCN